MSPAIHYSDGTVRQGQMLSAAQLPELRLEGEDLTSIHLDYQTHLQFGAVRVTFETAFSLTDGGITTWFDFDARSTFGPIVAIFPNTVKSATVNSELTLHLEFVGGQVLDAPQNSSYESWQISGPDTRLIVCPPAGGDGGLAVWL